MSRVLIVEDEKHLLALYRQELEDEGYEVMSVSNGEDVLPSIKSFQPEVVILDIRLPGVEGLEVLEQARAEINATIRMLNG